MFEFIEEKSLDDEYFPLKVTNDLNVKDVMDTWTKQMGLPYINVSVDDSGKIVTVEQRRFLADSSAAFNSSASQFR